MMKLLFFDGALIPSPDSYDISTEDLLSDGSGETEAGTQQRDFKRRDVITISLSFTVTVKWLKKFKEYRIKDHILVKYDRSGILEERFMYMDGYKQKLEHETQSGGIWTVSFDLKC